LANGFLAGERIAVLEALMGTRQSLAIPDLQFPGNEKLQRLSDFVRALATENRRLLQMIAAGSAGQVLTKQSATDYDAKWSAGASGSITGAQNLGTAGVGIFASVTGTLIGLKQLIAGSNITLTPSTNAITISAAGGAGGVGTVTSVSIASGDLTQSGSPITSAGTITLTIANGAVTYPKMQALSDDGLVLGRRIGDGAGQVEELTAADLRAIVGVSTGGYPKQLGYAGI
jgi:hypothetical protein